MGKVNRRMAPARVRSLSLFAAILAVTLILVTACGDDESDTSTGDTDEVAETEVAESEDQEDEPTPTAVSQSDSEESTEIEPEEPAEQEGEQESVQQPEMQWEQPPEMQLQDGENYQAVLTTNRGQVVIDLLQDEAPMTVNNFVFLAEQGFYSNVPFHRVINGFMIQTGDPTGTGRGGPGYRFDDEPISREYSPGTVAMANAGPNTNGSQFFIVHGDLRGQLAKNYTIFGEVTDGMHVVDEIANVGVQPSPTGEMSSPTEEVFIESVEIRH